MSKTNRTKGNGAGRSTCSATTSSSPVSGSTDRSGQLGGQLRDVAYRPRRPNSGARWTPSAGHRPTCSAARSTAEGSARPGRPGQSRLPVSVFRGVNILNTIQEAAEMSDQHRRDRRAARSPLSPADGCVVLADESSSANLRWANNTLTTNGVTRWPQVHGHRVDQRGGGHRGRRGVASAGVPPRRAGRPRPRRGAPARATAARRRTPAPLVDAATGEPAATGTTRRRDLQRRLRRRSRRRSATAFDAAAAADAAAVRLRRARRDLQVPRHVDRSAAAPRPADRHARDHRQVGRLARRPGPARRPATSRDVDIDGDRRRARAAARLGRAAHRPAGRPLRDDPAARRGRRPDGLPVLDGRRPRRPRRPHRLQPRRRRHPGRRRSCPTCR